MDTETPESATSLQYEPSASTGDPCSAGYSPTRKFPACVCPSLSCDFLLQMRPAYLQSSSSAQLMTDPPLRLCTDSLPRGWKTGLGCASKNPVLPPDRTGVPPVTGAGKELEPPRKKLLAALKTSCFPLSFQSFQAMSPSQRHCATPTFCNCCLTWPQSQDSGLHAVPTPEQLQPPPEPKPRLSALPAC